MGRKLAATHSLDSAFNLYADLKHKNLRQYDLSKAAVNSFGTVLLQHFQDKEKAIAGFQFCTQQFPLSAKVISILQKPTPPKEISPVPEQR